MRTRKWLWIVLAVMAAFVMSCQKDESKPATKDGGNENTAAANPQAETPANETAGKQAPAFTLTDQEGNSHSLADFKGKVVVLEWVNPECPYVQFHYAPERRTMVKLAEKYQPQGVVWLAVNSTHFHDQAANKKWHDGENLPYPVLDDHGGEAGKAYQAKATPHLFIIDKNGMIIYDGAIDDNSDIKGEAGVNYVALALDAELAGKKPETSQTKPYGCSVKYKP